MKTIIILLIVLFAVLAARYILTDAKENAIYDIGITTKAEITRLEYSSDPDLREYDVWVKYINQQGRTYEAKTNIKLGGKTTHKPGNKMIIKYLPQRPYDVVFVEFVKGE